MLPTQSQASALVLATTGHPPAGSTCDRLVKLCSRFYKLLAALAADQLAASRHRAPGSRAAPAPLPAAFVDLVAGVNSALTPAVYVFIQQAQLEAMDAALEGKEIARGSAKVAKRARRESHLVPGLIFQVEDYEKQLVRLSKTGAWVGWSGG